jgi:hypothetical protein
LNRDRLSLQAPGPPTFPPGNPQPLRPASPRLSFSGGMTQPSRPMSPLRPASPRANPSVGGGINLGNWNPYNATQPQRPLSPQMRTSISARPLSPRMQQPPKPEIPDYVKKLRADWMASHPGMQPPGAQPSVIAAFQAAPKTQPTEYWGGLASTKWRRDAETYGGPQFNPTKYQNPIYRAP